MRILVLGAGAIGGYFGGRLVESGADVTFLVRERRAAQLALYGLVIKSPVGNATLQVKTAAQATEPADVVILTCKAYDLPEAVDAIAPAVGPGSVVLPLLNGLRHLETLDARFGAPRVLGGLCHIGATLSDAGEVVHLSAPAFFALGPRDPGQAEVCSRLHAILKRGGFAPVLSNVIMQDMWEKFAFIAAYAGITCLMRAPIGAIVGAEEGERLALGMFDECAAVARVSKFQLREKFIAQSRRTLSERGSQATSSMLRDIRRDARIEHVHIHGDLLARARELGIDTPLLRIAYAHLEAYSAQREA